MPRTICWVVVVAVAMSALSRTSEAGEGQYAVVVSKATRDDCAWGAVVKALVAKHQATVVTFESAIDEAGPGLREIFPRYTCVVARPEEAGREFVAKVHEVMRSLDGDPYTDTLWAILTGYDAENALTIAQYDRPLVVRNVAAGTDVALDMCEQGKWYCELRQRHMVEKRPGGLPTPLEAPGDTTKALVDALNDDRPDLFVTSGHATERDWQIGFAYRNGKFRSADGLLFGEDTNGRKFPVRSSNPKVYMPVGNCLMGHIDGRDAMALAWMKSAGVYSMIGYTDVTWYGYGGWGCLDYFVEQPGRYTFAEAFHANLNALVSRLTTAWANRALPDEDRRGLLHDRDTVVLYGDPAWDARMAEHPKAWDQSLAIDGDHYVFTIRPNRGTHTFDPINVNGSQRGGRPIVAFFPRRVGQFEILEGAELCPIIMDNFLLVPNPGVCDPEKTYRVVFRVTPQTVKRSSTGR